MNLIDYLEYKHKDLLELFIANQIGCPSYSHENNVEVGVSYEECLPASGRFPELKRINQSTGEGYVKCDIIYSPSNIEIIKSLEVKTEMAEIKTGTYDLLHTDNQGNPGMAVCKYKKKNGNSNELIGNLPDVILFYQKFSLKLGRPAIVGAMSKKTLSGIFSPNSEKLIPNDSNIDFIFNIEDLEWY